VTNRAEDVLYASLTDINALEIVAREQIKLDIIPTEGMRQVVAWAVQQFFDSGQTKAPSRAALLSSWGDTIESCSVELIPEDEEIDNVTWAISDLRSRYTGVMFQSWLRKAATEVAGAAPEDKVAVVSTHAGTLMDLVLQMQSRSENQDAVDGVRDALIEYDKRAALGDTVMGMGMGIPEIDEYVFGIHPGEVAVFAAPAKAGKSHLLVWAGRQAWRKKRRTVLFTLENSKRMTDDRIVCQELGIDSESWEAGQCEPEEKERVQLWLDAHSEDYRDWLRVIAPEDGARTPTALVRQAQLLGADSIIIDQLPWVVHPNPGKKAQWEQASDIMKQLHDLVRSPSHPMSCLIAHQIKGDGVERVHKSGWLRMTDLAYGREVERAADAVFSVLQTPEQAKAQMATFQILAHRRRPLKAWDLMWRPWMGDIQVVGEAEEQA
jgi:hypothetical protein